MNEIVAAQIAYDAFRKSDREKAPHYPEWDAIGCEEQQAWINAAAEVMASLAASVLA